MGEGPAVFEHVVVSSADEDEVVEVGGSAVGVGDDVVGVAPVRWSGTVGDDAAAVAVFECASLRW